jgi:hypothetical protein
MKWFRLYDEFQHDTKLRRMPIPHRYAFVILLCMANRSSVRGVILNLDDEDLAFELEMQTEDWLTLKSKFRAKGLIEPVQGGIKITNWDDRQFASDSSAERVAAYRRKKIGRDCNVTPPLQKRDCNALDTDTDPNSDPNSDPENRSRKQIQKEEEPDRAENLPDRGIDTENSQPVKKEATANDSKQKRRQGRKSSGGALTATVESNPEAFDLWWKSYYEMCGLIDVSAGSKKQALQEWLTNLETYQSQHFQACDRAYAEQCGREFRAKGQVFGVAHGVRYLRSTKWQEAFDRSQLRQASGMNLATPQATKAAIESAARKAEFDRLRKKFEAEEAEHYANF